MHIDVVVDCDDADRMVTFWTEALGYEYLGALEQYRKIQDPTGEGPALLFQQVPAGHRTAGKNSLHLDMHVANVDSTVERLQGLGATELHRMQMGSTSWVTMLDVEGNQFCVCHHDEPSA